MKYLLIFVLLAAGLAAPEADLVHFSIPYKYPFYSGTSLITQDFLTSPRLASIMSSLNRSGTQTMIHLSCGLTVDLAALHLSE